MENIREVYLDFRGKPHAYLTANLMKWDLFSEQTDFRRSTFDVYENSAFDINGTRIERGQVGYDQGFQAERTGLQFTDVEDFLVKEREIVIGTGEFCFPSKLLLKLRPLPSVFHFDSLEIFFHERFALKVRKIKNPGMIFPGPAITVTNKL